jgi:hypothetical protein
MLVVCDAAVQSGSVDGAGHDFTIADRARFDVVDRLGLTRRVFDENFAVNHVGYYRNRAVSI